MPWIVVHCKRFRKRSPPLCQKNIVNIKDNNGLLANFTSCYHLHITISSNPGRGKKRSVKRWTAPHDTFNLLSSIIFHLKDGGSPVFSTFSGGCFNLLLTCSCNLRVWTIPTDSSKYASLFRVVWSLFEATALRMIKAGKYGKEEISEMTGVSLKRVGELIRQEKEEKKNPVMAWAMSKTDPTSRKTNFPLVGPLH